MTNHYHAPSRRQMLRRFANGFGMIGLAGLLAEDVMAAAASGVAPVSPSLRGPNPLAVLPPHYTAKAKRIIFLFMSGGPSHIDLFDPKPKLAEYAGKPLPFEQPKLVRTQTVNCFPSPYKFNKHGRGGVEISELLPHIGSVADELCVVKSMVADNINHN